MLKRLAIIVSACVLLTGCATGNSAELTGPPAGDGTLAGTPACQARPVTRSSGFTRTETPVAWNYRATEPSTSGCHGAGKVYEVGPGRKYANPRDVPWIDLTPCDTVLIHWRPEPYTDVIAISVRGEADRYITIKGVPGPDGQRPILDGNGAVLSEDTVLHPGLDTAGLIIITKPYLPNGLYRYKPGYLLISGLHLRNVRAPSKISSKRNGRREWASFSPAIYASPVEHLALIDNEIEGNSLGLFVNSKDDEDGQSRDLLIRGNYFHDNGVYDGASQHNAYTEAIGTIYEYNYFGPPLSRSGADNIKERSAGVIFRYNTIVDGVNLIALRDPESNGRFEAAALDCLGEKLVSAAYVYGNVMVARRINPWDEMPIVLAHGDGVDGGQVRYGSIYFYANQVIAQLDQEKDARPSVPLFNPINTRSPFNPANPESTVTVVARNNLFFTEKLTTGGTVAPFALFFWQGKADFQSNWINRFVPVHASHGSSEGLAVGRKFDGSGLGGLAASTDAPGFVDLAHGDLRLSPTSPFFRLNAPLPASVIRRGLQPTGTAVLKPFGPH